MQGRMPCKETCTKSSRCDAGHRGRCRTHSGDDGQFFSWLQNAMSASPWANIELNRKLMSYATESVSAYVEHTQRLSQAKNIDDAVKIQTEFVQAQIEVFNQRAKELGEIYAKMATGRLST
jgi:hypothetical protein